MKNYLFVGSYISIFLIFIASILGIVELADDYDRCELLLSLNALFYAIMLLLVEKYSKYITIHDASNHTTINEYTFRFIFHTWGGITLIGTSDTGPYISIFVILYGVWNLVYNVKFNNGDVPNTSSRNVSNITEDAFTPTDSPPNRNPFT